MVKLFCFIVINIAFLALSHLSAQNTLLPAYDLKDDSAALYTIDSTHTQILKDPENKWNITEVSQAPLTNNFYTNNTRTDFSIKTYWLRFRIHNSLGKEVNLHFLNGSGNYDLFEYYYLYLQDSTGKWLEQKTGILTPWNNKDGTRVISSIVVNLLPNQERTIYVRLHNSFIQAKPTYLNVNFKSELSFYKSAYSDYIEGPIFKYTLLRMLFVGIFLATILFSLYNYILIRERAYLYYLFFLLFYSIVQFPYNFKFLLFPAYPEIIYWGRFVFWILVHLFLVQFIREYLNTKVNAPKWDKLLIASVVLMPVYLIFFLLITPLAPPSYDSFMNAGIALTYEIVVFTIALTLIHLYRKKYQPAKFLLLTLAPFLIIWSVVEFASIIYSIINELLTGNSDNPLSSINFFFYAEFFTTSWIVLFFSTALTRNYTDARKVLAQQAVEKERTEKEMEIQKRELIQKQKIDLEKQVAERTAEVVHQKEAVENTLKELQSTQAQLIQSEKMASLGELTAGIAHEIQNPLNFVNNFSELNTELIKEMVEEVDKGNITEVKAIAKDIQDNEEKINHHGKRADAIVKGMLQHSRSSSGQKEPTDINALADEYLRLAYHGLRAKDKSFNATLKTDFDESIGRINIIPQDIGRVILNLITNAFYVVGEKKKENPGGYDPTVAISTKKIGNKVEIKVSDNGNGIPQKVLDKIFQPFFTTKPTGQGTGLGLSLSYDIVKAHGGELKVETKEGEGTIFIIQLPVV